MYIHLIPSSDPITDGVEVITGSQFGQGAGPIFLDQLRCSGTESSLLECDRFAGLGLHSCDHSQDAGVSCIGEWYHWSYMDGKTAETVRPVDWKTFWSCCIHLCHVQMLMNVTLTMVDVTTTVPTLLVALSAVATLVTPWREIDMPALVSFK